MSVTIDDRRKDSRVSANKRGRIKFGPSGQEMPCTVEDLTAAGAGLQVGSTFGLPKVFRLTVDGDSETRHCRVVWTDGKKLGVSFE
jgi:PilZ domain